MSHAKQTTTYDAVLGRILAEQRSELKYSQKKMAEHLGLSQSAWSRIETGDNSLSVAQLVQVSRKLNRNPQSFLSEVDNAIIQLNRIGVQVHLEESKPDFVSMAVVGVALGALISLATSR